MAIILVYTHTHTNEHPFAAGLFKTLSIPARTVREITIKGMPLLVNELLWAMGTATLNQIYSLRGLDVIAATNITNVVFNLFSVSSFAMGSAVAIIVGRDLGADEPETAKDHAWKLIAFAFVLSLGIAVVLALLSPYVPLMYNATASVQQLASRLILVCACVMPIISIVNCDYFILRSGGKTGLTFLFDSGFAWGLCIPLAYCLVHFTPWNVVMIYLCVHLLEIIKCGIGYVLVKKGIWINNIVSA